jgi:hypothetical protein
LNAQNDSNAMKILKGQFKVDLKRKKDKLCPEEKLT